MSIRVQVALVQNGCVIRCHYQNRKKTIVYGIKIFEA